MAVDAAQAQLDAGLAAGLFSDASLAVLYADGRQVQASVGQATWFDLASLTKPLVVGMLSARAISQGRLDPNAPVESYLPAFQGESKANITVADLLRHRAGLIPYRDWYREAKTAPDLITNVAHEPLASTPHSDAVYSDAGFILLGAILSTLGGPLATQFGKEILAPLDESEVTYGPLSPELKAQTAVTGTCPWRHRQLQGEVHDANAATLGDIAGHAGLFGTAAAVSRLAMAWLQPHRLGQLAITKDIAAHYTTIPAFGRPWAWDRTGPGPSQAGHLAPGDTFGHLGFTGTSVWVSPQRDLAVTLLTNRVAYDTDGARFRAWRPKFYDLVWRGSVSAVSFFGAS